MSKPRAVLVWSDGREEPIAYAEGMYYVVPRKLETGRILETTFALHDVTDGGQRRYVEASSKDVTALYRETAERGRVERMLALVGCIPDPGAFANGYLPGETAEEHRRRVNIMHGREPENDG